MSLAFIFSSHSRVIMFIMDRFILSPVVEVVDRHVGLGEVPLHMRVELLEELVGGLAASLLHLGEVQKGILRQFSIV